MQDSHNHAKTWNSTNVLGSMFGWKSDIFSQREIKSELRAKIKKKDLLSMSVLMGHRTDDAGTAEPLDNFCGICYLELGKVFQVLKFKSIYKNDKFLAALQAFA